MLRLSPSLPGPAACGLTSLDTSSSMGQQTTEKGRAMGDTQKKGLERRQSGETQDYCRLPEEWVPSASLTTVAARGALDPLLCLLPQGHGSWRAFQNPPHSASWGRKGKEGWGRVGRGLGDITSLRAELQQSQ